MAVQRSVVSELTLLVPRLLQDVGGDGDRRHNVLSACWAVPTPGGDARERRGEAVQMVPIVAVVAQEHLSLSVRQMADLAREVCRRACELRNHPVVDVRQVARCDVAHVRRASLATPPLQGDGACRSKA